MEANSGTSDGQEKKCCRPIPWLTIWTHIGLYTLTAGYLFLGGLLFNALESPHEKDTLAQVVTLRENFIQNLCNISNTSADNLNFTATVRELLDDYEVELQLAWKQGWRSHREDKWGFLSACFYCLTVVSTIGYGHITPTTQLGRLATMIYAILGIPIFFVFLAKVGQIVAIPLRSINSVIIRSCTKCPDCESCTGSDSVSRIGSVISMFNPDGGYDNSRHEDDDDILEYKVTAISDLYDDDQSGCDSNMQQIRLSPEIPGIPDDDTILKSISSEDEVGNKFADDESSSVHVATQTEDVVLENASKNRYRRSDVLRQMKNLDEAVPVEERNGFGINKNFHRSHSTRLRRAWRRTLLTRLPKEKRVEVPISILLFLQLTYILGGAALMNTAQDDWTFLDSVYFSTITFLTVGFGDLIPVYGNSANNVFQTTTFISIYIVIGLILMSSCINLSQQRIVRFSRVMMKGCTKRRKSPCCETCCR
ncbi:potassium channel subfamily K member 18-like [Glandiceps talaboti]